MPFTLVRGDITRCPADAIVNAANPQLAQGGGVCGAIFAAAGPAQLAAACQAAAPCPVGSAVHTPAFALPAKYIIHAVGPVWQGGTAGEAALLHRCYLSALTLAGELGCRSIAFPLISAGLYGYPQDQAMAVATGAIREFLQDAELDVILCLYRQALPPDTVGAGLARYIAGHFNRPRMFPAAAPMSQQSAVPGPRRLADVVAQLEDSFSQMLLRLIDQRGMTDVQVYKRANLDRKLFSKLRKEGYNPSKPTAIALAIALELNLDQTQDLLRRAGYALSASNKADVIVSYFIQEGIFDIYTINEALFAYGQKLLGA